MNDTSKEMAEALKPEIKAAVREAVRASLESYDSLSVLPEIMSLSDAAQHTGISVHTLRYYNKQGLISFLRVGNGRGKMQVKKSELMKLMTEI